MTTVTPKVAIYCRLSDEDRHKVHSEDESESIKNQKIMLTQYAITQGWDIYHIYSDEDFTGSDRNRPDFNRLLKDAEQGKFNIVLCKTQSRFTRELEMVERYIHYLFPLWGIRFISIVDNADTDNKGNKKSRQINGLINEWYLEDMSENIRAVLTNKRRNGCFIGAFAPYGYKKDPDKKGHLIIDEPAAEVVRRIYDLYLSGVGRTSIARVLNRDNILTPTEYKKVSGHDYRHPKYKGVPIWRYYMITNILTNEVYIGNLVQNKTHSISFKSKKLKPTDKSEWIRVENTHEPIVDKDTWDRAQRIALSRNNHSPHSLTVPVNIFHNKLFCSKCGGSLGRYKTANSIGCCCSTHRYDPDRCDGVRISDKMLFSAVFPEIRRHIKELCDIDDITKSVSINDNYEKRLFVAKKKLSDLQKKQRETLNCIKNLYLDKVKGNITEETYFELSASFTKDNEQCRQAIESIESQINAISDECKNVKGKLEVVKNYIDCDDIDFAIVDMLIDKIIVLPREPYSRVANIEIYWNF